MNNDPKIKIITNPVERHGNVHASYIGWVEDEMYGRVADAYAAWVEEAFTSEDTLRKAWKEKYVLLPFDRTVHWGFILSNKLNEVWKKHGPVVLSNCTLMDQACILYALATRLDYNLFTQVMLNLQPKGIITYRTQDADRDLASLQEEWKDITPNPFDAKAKMLRVAGDAASEKYDHALSKIKALRIIAKSASGMKANFRVSPKGSTPALVDSENLSSLGTGADEYLCIPPGYSAYYFTWDIPAPAIMPDGNQFSAEGIAYKFASKSGGDILYASLYSRHIMHSVYMEMGPIKPPLVQAFLPRLNSILLMTNQASGEMKPVLDAIQKKYPGVKVHYGVRKPIMQS